MKYANALNPSPQRLPDTWRDPSGRLHMGLQSKSDADLAALGWHPVRYAPLEPGAAGRGEMYLDEQAGEWVVPSLPGDPAAAEQQRIESMTVTALQGELAIAQAGMAQAFNAWKASLDPDTDFAAIAFLNRAPTWRRDSPYLLQGAAALGLTDQQLDGLFALAATL